MVCTYQKELDLTTDILKRMRLPVHRLPPQAVPVFLDHGIRSTLGLPDEDETLHHTPFQWTNQRTIYKILDRFLCNYLFFHLPQTDPPEAIVIGPYLTIDPTREMLLEQLEKMEASPEMLPRLMNYYAAMPVFHDPSPIMAVMTSLGVSLWKEESLFDVSDVSYEQVISLQGMPAEEAADDETDVLLRMKQLEDRYAFENELMTIVSKGLTNRAEVMMSSVSQLNYQNRVADPLRNMKNYCIICNTLLRKAAQQGGVHPLYLDEMSGRFARQIEVAPTLDQANAMLSRMIRGYCRLVRAHAERNYSAVVQKVITYIDANLSGELSLRSIAKKIRISQGYLSSLFHQETGQTLAAYITAQRMKTALQLLQGSRLQVQTVAQLSGFSDPNYFGKLFKRHYGVTPLQFRREHLSTAGNSEG